MGCLVILLSTLLLLCHGFDIKTRQHCCSLGTNYSSNNQACKTFQPPIPGVSTIDERACLNTVDFCCKKEMRIKQCDLGKEDAKSNCTEIEGDRQDCCEACRLGIESKKLGDLCFDTLQLGQPYSDAFISCCEEADKKATTTFATITTPRVFLSTQATTSAESAKYSKPFEEAAFYPGLSEENVCETREFCAQLCNPSGDGNFKCSCFPGYQLMKDGVSCKPMKRAKGSRCEENNPCDHDCIDTGTSVECSCREGYELGQDKKSCKDIDECALGIYQCEAGEECENDEGTYLCFVTELDADEESYSKCPLGHRFNAEKSVCDDIDECEIPLICPPPKVCKNTNGSFKCDGPDCPPGFYYKASIEACTDIDECISGDNDCNKDSQLCVNTKGNYTCVDKASRQACPAGFRKNVETLLCEDINECEDDLKVCLKDEQCINEEGGYKCINSNNQLINNNIPINIPLTTSKSLVPRSCPHGFKYNMTQNTCDDINECQLSLDNCSPMHRCDNSIGSFYCTRTVSCGTGYTLNSANDLCEDDDECTLGTHNCYDLGTNYRCKNQMGTYRCEPLRPIYRPPPATSSTTTTTTSTTTSKPSIVTVPRTTLRASTTSTNTYTSMTRETSPRNTGNYKTSTLKPIPIRNPWGEPFYGNNRKPWWLTQQEKAGIPNQLTTRRVPTYVTRAPIRQVPYNPYSRTPYEPFHIQTKKTTILPKIIPTYVTRAPIRLEPYNPYSRTPYEPFHIETKKTTILPIINDMLKKCLPGYKMSANGDCEDINECESNPCPRGSKCTNFNGRYQCSSPLYCKIGYEPNEAGDGCVDVDECAKGIHNCSKTQICKNGQGYYTCECPPGHHLNRMTQACEDLDECKFYKPCGNYAECKNTIGSFECSCHSGFRMIQNACHEINECEENRDLCQDICINLWGSYRCACKPGYTLNPDNRTCADINECERFKDRKLCIGHCVNIPGSYSCDCPKGYKLGSDKRVCIDIDECQQNVCGPQDACVNIRGSFKCYPITCTNHYVKDPNHKARCKRLTCDARDNQCLLMPEQYSYQYFALVSNLPLSEDGIPLFKIKGPDWSAAVAEFSLKLLEVNCPPGVKRVDSSYVKKVDHENNLMELSLVKSIDGPQEVKLEVEMKLYQRNTLIGRVVVYIIIVVSEYTF